MLLVVASLVLAGSLQAQRPAPPPPYNPTANPSAQIAAALKSAAEDGIRVLVNFGANDDESSLAFDKARRTRDLSGFFSSEYKVVNVDVGHVDKNIEIASGYGVTLTAGTLPMLVVLDAKGGVLTRTPAAAFKSDGNAAEYDAAKIGAFLKTHQAPPAPDAEPLLEQAVKQAKTEGKSVFVWFSAPW